MKLDGQEVDPAALRARLGLAADADEAAIKAALGIGPARDANGFAIPPQHAAPTPVAASAQVPAGMVLIDGAALEQIKAGAQAGETVAARLGEQDRDGVIKFGIEDGRIVAASREQWVTRWGPNGEGADEVRKLLTASIQEGGLASVIPVKARETGTSGDGSDPRAEAGAHESYMQTFFPQDRARLRGEHNGGRVRAGAE